MHALELLVLAGVFVTLLVLGIPISVAIGVATLSTMLVTIQPLAAVTTVAQRLATGVDSFTLLAIPFFILAGELINRGGMAKRLVALAKLVVGRLPGGLLYVNVLACMLFGAISGSAVAAAAAIGGFMAPLLLKEGYDRDVGAAVNITSATTGLVIPPSNVMIVYSLASGGVSIGALFMAGYVPGIILGLSIMAVAAIISVRRGYPVAERVGLREGVRIVLDAMPSLALVIVVIGGIVGGYFTATEASAVAVVYALVVGLVVHREIRLADLHPILLTSATTTAIITLLIGTSMGMSWVMAYEQIPQAVTAGLTTLSSNPVVVLLVINVILLAVGTFMDMTPAVLIFTPIFLPVVTGLGVDPLHFGIIMIMNLCIGLCTPPVGSVLFVGCGVANTSIAKVVRPLLPMFLAMVAALLLVTFVPELSLAVPRWLGF